VADSNGPEPDTAVRAVLDERAPSTQHEWMGAPHGRSSGRAVVDAVERANATAADVQGLVDVLAAAARDRLSTDEAAARIEQQAPMFGSLRRWLQATRGSWRCSPSSSRS
jgi:hypothetical protein